MKTQNKNLKNKKIKLLPMYTYKKMKVNKQI